MVSLVVMEMGGEVPRRDARLLPNGAAAEAWNTDLASGALDGLPAPTLLRDFNLVPGAPSVIRRAYYFPNPGGVQEQGDCWLPLPSPYSSVVRSPLADDTLHRLYWTNPGEGAFWSTFSDIYAGRDPYHLGFTSPDPTPMNVTASGGDLPVFEATNYAVNFGGFGAAVGQELIATGGVLQPGFTAAVFTVASTQVTAWFLQNPGLLPADGEPVADGLYACIGTTGVGDRLQIYVQVTNRAVTGIETPFDFGNYTTNPTDPSNEPMVCPDLPQLLGLTLALGIGVRDLTIKEPGGYAAPPENPVALHALGVTLNVSWTTTGVAPVERSYLYTLVDIYGLESSPNTPSAVVSGASDGRWTLYGVPTAPQPSPYGKNYPPVRRARIYRTVAGTGAAATFYRIADYSLIDLPANVAGAIFVDGVTDTVAVGNPVLESATWASPPEGLDGLTGMQGGMLLGFVGNTIHFCEPNRPHAWVAAYDLAVQYPIVGFGVWNGTLMVLTKGFPSQGNGNTPATFTLSQLQVAEPCIARGSIVTDLAGVAYASQNGLVVLNASGASSPTETLIAPRSWQNDFRAPAIVAARHRNQYIGLTGRGSGFLIDYAESRLGVVRLDTFNGADCIWNDVYTGDVMVMADRRVYRWDNPAAPRMVWRWRSKRFMSSQAVNFGACSITMSEDAVIAARSPPLTPPLANGDPRLTVPAGAAAVFRLYKNDGVLVFEKPLATARPIFRLPSGFKTNDYQFEVVSRTPIWRIELASSMRELADV